MTTCDGCGKVRKCHVVARDRNGDPELGFCFLCAVESRRGRVWSHKLARYTWPEMLHHTGEAAG